MAVSAVVEHSRHPGDGAGKMVKRDIFQSGTRQHSMRDVSSLLQQVGGPRKPSKVSREPVLTPIDSQDGSTFSARSNISSSRSTVTAPLAESVQRYCTSGGRVDDKRRQTRGNPRQRDFKRAT